MVYRFESCLCVQVNEANIDDAPNSKTVDLRL